MESEKTITRERAIEDLREVLLSVVDEEHSICDIADRLGIFCGGFGQWTFSELRKRYPTIVRSRPRITPKQLKELANRWQLARSEVMSTRLACDTQMKEGELQTCCGWNEFSDQQLAEFYCDICGEEVSIGPEPAQPAPAATPTSSDSARDGGDSPAPARGASGAPGSP